MKKQTLRLNTPCTENWEDMDMLEQGRFCHSCEKMVVDFTKMSDAEILSFFETHKGQRICGRMRKGQLDRALVAADKTEPAAPARRMGTSWQLLLASLAVGTWMVTATPVLRAAALPQIEYAISADHRQEPTGRGFSGKVMEQHEGHTPIANATVELLDAENNRIASTTTNAQGVFTFKEAPSNVVHIQIYAEGYEVVYQTLDKKLKSQEFFLGYEIELMGDIMIEE